MNFKNSIKNKYTFDIPKYQEGGGYGNKYKIKILAKLNFTS